MSVYLLVSVQDKTQTFQNFFQIFIFELFSPIFLSSFKKFQTKLGIKFFVCKIEIND